MKKELTIAIGVIVFAVLIAIILTVTEAESAKPVDVIEPVRSSSSIISNNSIPSNSSELEATESAFDVVDIPETHSQPPVTSNAPQEQQKQPQLERIPFTNKPVTAGEPESYVDTYGQCPFYENAGPKGCVPPPDIECNEDWSVCTYKGGDSE